MHSKIYKAKIISIHATQTIENQQDKQRGRQPIHAYFGMLQHIFQRNKQMIKEFKLSGTKIQKKIIEDKKINKMHSSQSDLFRIKNRQQKQKGQPKGQLHILKSAPFIYRSLRHRSVQPRQVKQTPSKKDSHFMTQVQMFEFIPLGQASQRNLLYSDQSLHQNQQQDQSPSKAEVIQLNLSDKNSLNQHKQYKQHTYRTKKLSLKVDRRSCRIRSETSQLKSNYSSIRTTQNSNNQANSEVKVRVSPLEVTPW